MLHRSLFGLSAVSSLSIVVSVAGWTDWKEAPAAEKKAPPDWAMVESSSCPMKRVKASSLDKLPAIPTIITDMADNWPAFAKWQDKAKFVEQFGDLPITHSPIAGPLQMVMGNVARTTEKLRDFVADMSEKQAFEIEVVEDPEYPGTDTAVHKVNEAVGAWKLPRSRWKFSGQATLSLGGHGLGLPFHVHGASWLAVITGMKVWFMYPPEMPEESYATVGITPVKKWVERDYIRKMPKQNMASGSLKGRPFRCLQQPGEIFFVPAHWHHATYNLGESLAVGSQSKLFPDQAKMAALKYPAAAQVLHQQMIHAASGPLNDQSYQQALEFGSNAMRAAPNNPKIALDQAMLMRKRGDEAGCHAILREYLAKIDKLLDEDMVLPGEAADTKRQLRDALGPAPLDGGEDEGAARPVHDEF